MSIIPKNIVIIGASGALGKAFTASLSQAYPDSAVHAISRHMPKNKLPNVSYNTIDYGDESSIEALALALSNTIPIDLVIVTIGILHEADIVPERSLKELCQKNLHRLFEVNTIIPALIAKHFLPTLNTETRSIFAVLSARVGSISDNRLGGWYAYRASKAALNMIIKSAAIEMKRHNQQAIVVGLHPGTVESNLSEPFQKNIPNEQLFTPQYSVSKLLEVLEMIKPEQSGQCFAWDGTEIEP